MSACFVTLFCLACNTVPENWHICVNKGLNYLENRLSNTFDWARFYSWFSIRLQSMIGWPASGSRPWVVCTHVSTQRMWPHVDTSRFPWACKPLQTYSNRKDEGYIYKKNIRKVNRFKPGLNEDINRHLERFRQLEFDKLARRRYAYPEPPIWWKNTSSLHGHPLVMSSLDMYHDLFE